MSTGKLLGIAVTVAVSAYFAHTVGHVFSDVIAQYMGQLLGAIR